jgi:hypothetical protein
MLNQVHVISCLLSAYHAHWAWWHRGLAQALVGGLEHGLHDRTDTLVVATGLHNNLKADTVIMRHVMSCLVMPTTTVDWPRPCSVVWYTACRNKDS